MVNFPIITMNFVLASAFSISLSLAIGRIFKNPEIAGTTAALISMLTLFLSMVAYDE
ncbi:hypothetical protein NSA47_05350 [Irregularibacter muris]|uniref:Uncharacterized protein n=1 Tax=Irregularibacter muris TaxID=1796619 RepID=A0AAE3HF86_9FIRM|nr:hypothetical protein [Irregularibacter muris]MCR1898415.1 hypothetical protein [Irregularibacter muris]